jgi:hypothetical protein
MTMTVSPQYLRWQAKSIPARSDFRGVFFLGLLAAGFFFVWQIMALPPFSAMAERLGPLSKSALDKGQFMPEFGAIIAGFIAFHFRREFQVSLDSRIAVPVAVAVIGALLVPLIVSIGVQDALHLAAGQAIVPPWHDALFHIQFRVIVTVLVLTILLPYALFVMWTATPDIGWAAVVLAAILYGFTFYLHSYRLEWMWPPRILIDLVMGISLCATLFRAAEYFVAVRFTAIIIGIMALVGGSILAGPSLFFLGFLMVLSGCALSERTWSVAGEGALLGWSRTAYAFVLAQPIVLSAWLIWGGRFSLSRPLLFAALAIVTQVAAVLLYALVQRPVLAVLLSRVPKPIK